MADGRFSKSPRPDPAVVALLEAALKAAKKGAVRAATVVLVSPVYEVEHHSAGYAGAAKHALIGGLSAEAHFLLRDS